MASAIEKEGTTSTADPARDFLEFWRNYFEQTAIQTRILLESMPGGKSPDQTQSQWLCSLSQSLDSFMRTPAFLDVLKQTLKRMVDLKVLQDQMAQSVALQTGMPQAADIAGLRERVQGAEQAILTRLAVLDDRLKAIEERLALDSTQKKRD
jgi:hypothetical protein